MCIGFVCLAGEKYRWMSTNCGCDFKVNNSRKQWLCQFMSRRLFPWLPPPHRWCKFRFHSCVNWTRFFLSIGRTSGNGMFPFCPTSWLTWCFVFFFSRYAVLDQISCLHNRNSVDAEAFKVTELMNFFYSSHHFASFFSFLIQFFATVLCLPKRRRQKIYFLLLLSLTDSHVIFAAT